jgi:hypothetical protein
MSDDQPERLYGLLPGLYRQRDLLRGEPLRALLGVLEREFQAIEADIAATYANWFIQTCDSWVIPYIADLVGVRDMDQAKHLFPTQRRQVANTVAYRRRKGTLSVLEHVISDVTGWAVAAQELSRDVTVTQDLAQLRPDAGLTVDLRDRMALVDADGAFSPLARTAEARRIDPALRRSVDLAGVSAEERVPRSRGKYQLPNVALYLWRLRSYAMTGNAAHLVEPGPLDGTWLYAFHPLGLPMPLFTHPLPVPTVTDRVWPVNVPAPITRALLAADLHAWLERSRGRRPGAQPSAPAPSSTTYYGLGRSLHVRYEQAVLANGGGAGQPVPVLNVSEVAVRPDEVVVLDLAGWRGRSMGRIFQAWAERGRKVAIDPEAGRLVWLDPSTRPGTVRVDYCYGFSGEIGGGPYRRSRVDREAGDQPANCTIPVAQHTAIDTLGKALQLWEQAVQIHPDNLNATIRILDSGVYDEELSIRLPARARLAIVAENGMRPALTGGQARKITIAGPAIQPGVDEAALVRGESPEERQLTGPQIAFNGLLIDARMRLTSSPERTVKRANGQTRTLREPAASTGLRLSIEHCTLLPRGSVHADLNELDARTLRVSIAYSIAGPLRLPATAAEVTITNSILDGDDGWAIVGPHELPQGRGVPLATRAGPVVTLNQVTVFGKIFVQRLLATDSLCTGQVRVEELAGPGSGAPDVSFTVLPENSQFGSDRPHPQAAAPGSPVPLFTSRTFGDPGYAQLSLECPLAILGGAEDGCELGVFHDLYQLQAEQNLYGVLDEYLPLGLTAGVFYVT